MGSIMHPTGPQPPQVYWRRRALVLGVVVAVLIAAVAVTWALWPKDQPQPALPSAPTSSSASGLPTPAVTPSSVTAAPPTSSAPATPAAPQACDPLSIRAGLAGFKKLTQGSAQVFKVSLTNTTAVPCVLAVTASNFVVVVTSGKDRIWTTADCAAWVPAKTVTLAPQQAYVFEVNWSGARSASKCKTTKATVGAGTYVAKATFTGAEPARLVMLVTPS
jgi:hypothetical protein